jgi:hypothetical protein
MNQVACPVSNLICILPYKLKHQPEYDPEHKIMW